MKKKSIRQEWLKIARTFEKTFRERTEFERDVTNKGLCKALLYLTPEQHREQMENQLYAHVRKIGKIDDYIWPVRQSCRALRMKKFHHRYDLKRAELARKFASEA